MINWFKDLLLWYGGGYGEPNPEVFKFIKRNKHFPQSDPIIFYKRSLILFYSFQRDVLPSSLADPDNESGRVFKFPEFFSFHPVVGLSY
jgi:hypothetical protein